MSSGSFKNVTYKLFYNFYLERNSCYPTRCEKINGKVDKPKHRKQIQIDIVCVLVYPLFHLYSLSLSLSLSGFSIK